MKAHAGEHYEKNRSLCCVVVDHVSLSTWHGVKASSEIAPPKTGSSYSDESKIAP